MPRAPAGEARFEGFADVRASFFRALAKHQSRDWFTAHRGEYESGWLEPMHALLGELSERIEGLFPRRQLGEPKVFRIFRDVRFSRDKSPYKTHVAGAIPLGGSGVVPGGPAAIYVHLGTDVYVGAGHYSLDPAQLERYRAAVLDERRGAELARITARLTKAGFTLGAYETLKKAPRGVDPAHPRVALLKQKGLVTGFPDLPTELITSRALIPWLLKGAKQTAPLVEWLAANVA
jgi:uncharacterized protein (TIGR02453 family)